MDINEEHRKRREGNNARARFYKAKDEILGDFKFIDYIESSKYISKMHGDFNKAMELDEDLAWSNREMNELDKHFFSSRNSFLSGFLLFFFCKRRNGSSPY